MYCCCVVSDHMLISIPSVSVEPLEMSCAEAAFALVPRARDLKPEDLLSPFLLIYVLKKLKFVLNPVPACPGVFLAYPAEMLPTLQPKT